MNEKSPRRAPLNLTAEQLDYKESKARNENKRARNRLHINKETLSGHENTNVSSLDYEMRRLKHELRGIKQTSGYFVFNQDTSDDNMRIRHRNKRRTKVKILKKRQTVSKTTDAIPELRKSNEGHKSTVKTISLPVLPTISSASSDSSAKNSSKSQEYGNKTQDISTQGNNSRVAVTLDSKGKSNNTNLIYSNDVLNATTNDEIANLSATNESDFKDANKNDNNLLGVNVEAARNRVQNRLAVGSESTFQVSDDGDLTPYMHVPPDGLPRTAYLLPPLEDLLCEAKKARYIRKLRKRNTVFEKDDPERELNIDEIFSKSR